MFLKQPINYWHIAFLGLLAASLWFTHVSRINQAIKTTTVSVMASEREGYQRKLDKAIGDAINTERAMQDADNALKQKKYEELKNLNVKLSADLISLQNRPTRPAPGSTNNSVTANSGSSCTARELYREDAEFLTREASRAEGVLIERNSYYDRYVETKRILDLLREKALP